jgi:predicted MFS family arabinose efflux permease
VRSLLRHRGFRLLLAGQGVSAFGDWMATIGFMALSLAITGSAVAVGVVLVLRLLPAMVAGPLATRLVARLDRRRTMLAMDAFRAVVAAVVPLVSAIWWVYLCALLLELGSVAFLPARDSSIPDLVADEHLPLANGLVLASSYGTIPFGAAAFAAASTPFAGPHGLAHGGVAPVFFIDAATFLVSFLCVRPLRELDRAADADAELAPGTSESAIGAGFLSALRIPLVRIIAPLAFAVALGLGALFSLGILFVRDVLHADNASFSFLVALFGIGAAAGLLFLRVIGDHGLGFVRLCIFAQGSVIALMSLASTLWLTYVGAVAFAFFTAASLATAMGVLQEALGGGARVQAFAVFHVLIRVGLGLAAVGAAVAADLVGSVNWPLVGHLPPVRLVLGCSGAAVAVIAVALRARFVAGATMASGARRAASPSASALDPSRPPPGAGATGNIAGAAQ